MPPANPPAATPAPIEDIVAPLSYFPYPWWLVAAVVVGGLALLAILVIVLFRLGAKRAPSPRQRALRRLAKLRAEAGDADARSFAISASDILRRYLHEAYGLRATTQTSIEFLHEIRGGSLFSEEEQQLLQAFLEQIDLAKYGRWDDVARDALIDAAERVINRSQQPAARKEAPAA